MASREDYNSEEHIAQELSTVIKDFSEAVIVAKPADIINFAADYFSILQNKNKRSPTPNEPLPVIQVNKCAQFTEARENSCCCGSSGAGTSPLEFSPEGIQWKEGNAGFQDEQYDTGDRVMAMPFSGSMAAIGNRRRSVAAESFDPEADQQFEPAVVHPKTATQRSRLSSVIKPIFLFQELDEDQMHRVVDAMKEMRVSEGETVISQGEDGEYFYVIESGSYDIIINGKRIGSYEGHGFFGELALMYNTPRAATIVCTYGGVLWGVDRSTFRRIVLKMAFMKRQLYDTWLTAVPLLRNLSVYERTNLADALVSRWVENGEWIVREGDPGSEMYFIEEGCVQITVKTDEGKEANVKTLGKNSYFGELALILKQPRQASARSIGRTKLAVLNVSSFERLMGPCSEVMLREAGHYQAELISLLGKTTCDIRHPALAALSMQGVMPTKPGAEPHL